MAAAPEIPLPASIAASRAVVVSGASSGIGEAAAFALDRLGYTVFAGVRRESDAGRLARDGSPRLRPIELDVTRESSLAAAARAVETTLAGAPLHGIVNNAGVLVTGPLEHVPIETLRRQLDVNVIGVLAMTQAFLPLLKRSRGRIVNVGSTSGRIAYPMTGPYCAAKFALEALTLVLRAELRPAGVTVSIIEPGVVRTPLWRKALAAETALAAALPADDSHAQELRRRSAMLERFGTRAEPPDAVAAAIAHALACRRPKRRYVVGMSTRLRTAALLSLPEGLRDWLRECRARPRQL